MSFIYRKPVSLKKVSFVSFDRAVNFSREAMSFSFRLIDEGEYERQFGESAISRANRKQLLRIMPVLLNPALHRTLRQAIRQKIRLKREPLN